MGNLVQGDLGESTNTGRPVVSDLWDRLPATAELGLFATAFAISVGVPLGVIAGVKRDGPLDFTVRGATLVGLAIPAFWLGLLLIFVFFVKLDWLPGPVGDYQSEPRRPDASPGCTPSTLRCGGTSPPRGKR